MLVSDIFSSSLSFPRFSFPSFFFLSFFLSFFFFFIITPTLIAICVVVIGYGVPASGSLEFPLIKTPRPASGALRAEIRHVNAKPERERGALARVRAR